MLGGAVILTIGLITALLVARRKQVTVSIAETRIRNEFASGRVVERRREVGQRSSGTLARGKLVDGRAPRQAPLRLP